MDGVVSRLHRENDILFPPLLYVPVSALRGAFGKAVKVTALAKLKSTTRRSNSTMSFDDDEFDLQTMNGRAGGLLGTYETTIRDWPKKSARVPNAAAIIPISQPI